ncbi:MAG: hypothetical protein KC516_01420 [Nanoarchaeota archaeon]|nr:hypothetical protein [Nanoarchaeota archaeon]
MNKKIFFSLILGVLVLGIVSASVTGFAVSVKEDSAKSFSYQDRDYSVELQKQDDGSIDVEINGEKFEGVKEGDVVSINGAEIEVKDLGKTWFLGKTQAQLEVKESTQLGDQSGLSCTCVDNQGINHYIYNCQASNCADCCKGVGWKQSSEATDNLNLEGNEQAIGSLYVGEIHKLPGENNINVFDNVRISSLSGDGFAYVCVNSVGELFRSYSPCVEPQESFEVKTSTQCYEDSLDFNQCDSCQEICDYYEKPSCYNSARARFGNLSYIPDYFEFTDCSSVQSTIQFRLYCNCA